MLDSRWFSYFYCRFTASRWHWLIGLVIRFRTKCFSLLFRVDMTFEYLDKGSVCVCVCVIPMTLRHFFSSSLLLLSSLSLGIRLSCSLPRILFVRSSYCYSGTSNSQKFRDVRRRKPFLSLSLVVVSSIYIYIYT